MSELAEKSEDSVSHEVAHIVGVPFAFKENWKTKKHLPFVCFELDYCSLTSQKAKKYSRRRDKLRIL